MLTKPRFQTLSCVTITVSRRGRNIMFALDDADDRGLMESVRPFGPRLSYQIDLVVETEKYPNLLSMLASLVRDADHEYQSRNRAKTLNALAKDGAVEAAKSELRESEI